MTEPRVDDTRPSLSFTLDLLDTPQNRAYIARLHADSMQVVSFGFNPDATPRQSWWRKWWQR